MELPEIFLIAVSLAMDAFAVSVSSGISVKGFSLRHAVTLGLWFGGFQFAMPLLGWALGSTVSRYIQAIGPYLAFAVLSLIGARMVWQAATGRGGDEEAMDTLTVHRLAALAVATSIDALAVGVSMAFLEVNILVAAAVIGVVAFLLSLLGGMLGRRLGSLFRRRAEIAGGLVLIAIGVKTLAEHLWA